MAREIKGANHTYIVMSRKEAANVCALLIGLLADEAVGKSHGGEIPVLRIEEEVGRPAYGLALTLKEGK